MWFAPSDGVFMMILSAVFSSVCSLLTFYFIFVWSLFPNSQRRNSTKNRTTATSTATAEGKCSLNPMMAYLLMIVSAVLMFHSLSANHKFHFRLNLNHKKSAHKQHKKENISRNNSRWEVMFEPSDSVFPMFFCSFYSPQIFTFFWRFFVLFSLLFYYNISAICIIDLYTTSQHNTINNKEEGRHSVC